MGASTERDGRSAERLVLLQALTASLARARRHEEIADVIIGEALPALEAEVGVVAVLSEDGRALRNVGFKGVDQATEDAWREYSIESQVPVAEAALRRQPIIVTTIEERNRRYPILAEVHGIEHGGAVTAFPLMVDGQLLGVLAFCFCDSREFGSEDMTFLTALADQCALAVERARLYALAEREIEVRKKSESLLRDANRRKDEFLAMLAHELRNPLAPIRTAAQLLQRIEISDPRVEQVRDVVERQSAHLSRIVDDLLDVSRITRGRLEVRRSRLDLIELVRATLNDHRNDLEGAGLRVTLELPSSRVWVMADATRLSQAIGNVLHNAQKFSDRGGAVVVRVTADTRSGEATIEIADRGIGMDRETLDGLFETFAQADRSLARTRGGLGLGLALVRGLMTLHEGRVEADSNGLGCGSSFRLVLPLHEPVDVRSESVPPPHAVGRRVLVIEDNVDAADMLRMLLELGGHEVEVAHAGDEGVRLAETFLPDFVISDIGLPGALDGYGVARALRTSATSVKDARLIALSGYGQEQDKERARLAGFDAHLTKPVDTKALQHLLASSPE